MNPALLNAEVNAPPALRVSGLNADLGPGRALTEVDLSIGAGELVAVAGEPGAGKTMLVRCIAGDTAPAGGEIFVGGRPMPADPAAAGRLGVAVVWQDLALCDNLDVAGNLLLGHETARLMSSEARLHAAAGALLDGLEISMPATTRLVGSLSGGQRQLVALAKAIARRPRLLVLDEPTAALGVMEAGQVEELISNLRSQGIAILLASRDIEQMFRLADRIVVLRHGQVVAELDPPSTHPDDLAALLSGQQVDSSARRQLTRLHGLADRLVSADPSSSLPLILSALGSALGTEKVCIHVVDGGSLLCDASLGFSPGEITPWSRLQVGPAGGPAGRAAAREEHVVEEDLRVSNPWAPFGDVAEPPATLSSWSVPVMGPAGVSAVITVFRPDPGGPGRDELDLLTLYAGYVASAVERDRLLNEVTARNRVLETIREMLETLAGPVTVAEGLTIALQSLRRGLQADEVGLITRLEDGPAWRAYSGPLGTDPDSISTSLREGAVSALSDARRDGSAREFDSSLRRDVVLAVPFMSPGGPTVLLATWSDLHVTPEETALIEDAAHSLRLALEREEAGLAHQEAAALRRSRQLQRGFLSRLSHELRTPLTAIRGYASSLLAPDVTWDGDSQQRFLERIAAESARLGRLVDDLLDFSAIESGVMRLQPDWCDIPLVVEAAVACLAPEQAAAVTVSCDPTLPAVWADHDRLEQVFVNLLNNAFCHNPPGTAVRVIADGPGPAHIEISVADDGPGFPIELAGNPFDSARRHRSRTAGAGLGLSIARGIVDAHGGLVELAGVTPGTTWRIRLPIEAVMLSPGAGDGGREDEIAALVDPLVPEPSISRSADV
ncbi:MAG TPA: ATP-binding cassette domain-containing protein [Solirubrobacteraceae bacterium]|jgi:signal transduction histidine kinase/ABC-type multidrug transport system ATPase subunit|nr:ATP-binding cassette domain-containing protein [Solirubrobacteraceae bacterium]